MTRQPIESSNIAKLGYDEATSTLEVEFKPARSGLAAVWQYVPIHREIFEAMCDPNESAGSILAVIKRDAGIVATRIETIEVVA